MNDTREYTIWNTPLSVLLRGRLGPAPVRVRRGPLTPVNDSTLPEPAKALITTVVKRTRLWKNEKQEIAEELLAHFGDGLEAGQSIEELIAKFGHPSKAAKLMRRAKKRNRPLWWKLMRGTAQAMACFVLLYAGLLGLFFVGHPSPTIDYTPRVNLISAAAPADQCAWPIYRQAWTSDDPTKVDADQYLFDQSTRRVIRHVFATDDPDQAAARAFLGQHAHLIDAMRVAASKRYLGLLVAPAGRLDPVDAKALGVTNAPTSFNGSSVRLPENSLVSILLPHLARLRSMEFLLTLDMEDAAAQDDSDRVLADYRAVVGMARHAREHPVWVSELVACAMVSSADQRLGWILEHQPQVLRGHEVAILHEMASARDLYAMDASLEHDMLLDIIQHVYTDSWSGSGRLTADGLKMLATFRTVSGSKVEPLALSDSPAKLAIAIPLAAASTSRRDATAYANHYRDLLQQDLARPMWEQLTIPAASTQYVGMLSKSAERDLDVLPVVMVSLSLEYGAQRSVQMRAVHDALMVGLALESDLSRTGRYPATLAELVPQYLPEPPMDLSTGQPLLYKLKDGKPLLYGRGLDGDDDGGVWVPEKGIAWPNVPRSGDWVLYPEPGEVPAPIREQPQQATAPAL